MQGSLCLIPHGIIEVNRNHFYLAGVVRKTELIWYMFDRSSLARMGQMYVKCKCDQ